MLSIDTETTGLDLFHGCRPFYVSTCDDNGNCTSWNWRVGLHDRKPRIPVCDRDELIKFIQMGGPVTEDNECRWCGMRCFQPTCHHCGGKQSVPIIFHNAKFDIRALRTVGVDIPSLIGWKNIHDTLLLAHIFHSEEPHGLKYLADKYLNIPSDDEEDLKEAVNAARRVARSINNRIRKGSTDFSHLKFISIAGPGHPQLANRSKPPTRGTWAMADYWLPAALHKLKPRLTKVFQDKIPEEWANICGKYGDLDAVRTTGLFIMYQQLLKKHEEYKELYETRRRLLQVTYEMEEHGASISLPRIAELQSQYSNDRELAQQQLSKMAGKDLNPNSPQQVAVFLFEDLKIPVRKTTDDGNASTGAEALRETREEEKLTAKQDKAIQRLLDYRKNGKMIDYLESYKLFGTPSPISKDYSVLHSTYNITGTKETRFSSNNPNLQNVSKQKEFNLRYCFCPYSGRWWIAADYDNIEMRLFAYMSGDKELIAAYERGESFHSVVSEILYPKEWAECERKGTSFKETYKDTYYQWVKNGNFASIYGASSYKSDQTYRVKGATRKIRKRLAKVDEFMNRCIDEAKQNGYVKTLQGYPLQVPSEKPYIATNYVVQGSAGYVICEAMNLCHNYLTDNPNLDSHMILQVHDEIIFDVPARPRSKTIAKKLAGIMEQPGLKHGIPLPVGPDLITECWSKGQAL